MTTPKRGHYSANPKGVVGHESLLIKGMEAGGDSTM